MGGASASPERSCSRVNQRASSSSPPTRTAAAGGGACAKAEHHRGGERPGLRGVVAHRAHGDAGLLRDLAHHRVLEALARFDEAGDGRVAPRRPARLAPEQRPLAVAHQHDDGRIEARKEFLPARGVGAASGSARRGWGASARRTRRSGARGRARSRVPARRRAAPPRRRPAPAVSGRSSSSRVPAGTAGGASAGRSTSTQRAPSIPAEQHQLRRALPRIPAARRWRGRRRAARAGRAAAAACPGRSGSGSQDRRVPRPIQSRVLALLGAPLDVRPGEEVRPLVIHPRLSAARVGAGAGFYWGPREIAHLVRRVAPIGRGRRNFAGWFTGAPAKLRILS